MKDKAAPQFTLMNQDDEPVSLKQFSGKWVVLYFYPKDNTSGCTREAVGFTEALDEFGELDAVILGVSPDSTASHRKFIDKHDLKVTLLSDPEKEVLQAYGAFGEKKNYGKTTMGVIRSTFLIDPEGIVRESWKNVRVNGHVEKVRDKLKSLRG